jgi:hypothetical protein
VRPNAHPLIWSLGSDAPGMEKLLPLVRGRELADLPTAATGRTLAVAELERRASRVLDGTEFAVRLIFYSSVAFARASH